MNYQNCYPDHCLEDWGSHTVFSFIQHTVGYIETETCNPVHKLCSYSDKNKYKNTIFKVASNDVRILCGHIMLFNFDRRLESINESELIK